MSIPPEEERVGTPATAFDISDKIGRIANRFQLVLESGIPAMISTGFPKNISRWLPIIGVIDKANYGLSETPIF